jgi:hypothetical protein
MEKQPTQKSSRTSSAISSTKRRSHGGSIKSELLSATHRTLGGITTAPAITRPITSLNRRNENEKPTLSFHCSSSNASLTFGMKKRQKLAKYTARLIRPSFRRCIASYFPTAATGIMSERSQRTSALRCKRQCRISSAPTLTSVPRFRLSGLGQQGEVLRRAS